MTNILMTGHEGFIGSALWERLSTKHDLMGVDIKSGDDILSCELPHPDVVEMVIHLAGIGGVRESLADPQKYWNNNVEGTKRIWTRMYRSFSTKCQQEKGQSLK